MKKRNIICFLPLIMLCFSCTQYNMSNSSTYEQKEVLEQKEEIVSLSAGEDYLYNFHIHNLDDIDGEGNWGNKGKIKNLQYSLYPGNEGLMLHLNGIFECITPGNSYDGLMYPSSIACELTINDENGLTKRIIGHFSGDGIRAGEKTLCVGLAGPLPMLPGTYEIKFRLCR